MSRDFVIEHINKRLTSRTPRHDRKGMQMDDPLGGIVDPIARLRDKSLVLQHPERERIADEIERLTKEAVVADQHIEAAWAERDQYLEQNVKLKAEIERLRRHRTELDCRYTMSNVADLSGSHCPPNEPCLRCKVERLTADGQRRIEENDRILVANARLRAENERLLTENVWLQGSNDRLQMNLRHAVLKDTKL